MTCPGGRCQKGIVVPARGPVDSVVVVLGESPGKTEAERGLPFVGPSGQLLNEAANATDFPLAGCRSEERRVGKECRLLCRSRWSPYH